MSDIIVKFKPQGNKQLVAAIKAIQNAQAGVTTTTKKHSKATQGLTNHTRLLNNSFATMRSNLLLINFAMSLGIRQLIGFGQQAAKLESMERAFITLSGGAENAAIAIEKLREATNGTMSDFDLFQQANNAMVLGVTRNADEMAMLFDMAQRLGRSLGEDTKNSVASLTIGIGRQSKMMLDNVGIIVKADEAYKKHAITLKKNVSELTKSEKQQAFMNAVIEAGKEALADLPEETLTAQDAYDKLSATTVNLTTQLGEVLNRGFVPIMIATTDYIAALDTDRVQKFVEVTTSLAVAFGVLKLRTVALALTVKMLPILYAASTQSIVIFTSVLAQMISPLMIAGTVIAGLTFGIIKLTGIFEDSSEEADELSNHVSTLNKTIEQLDPSEAIKNLDDFYVKLSEGNNLLSMTIQSFETDLVQAVIKLKKQSKEWKLDNISIDENSKFSDILKDTHNNYLDFLKNVRETWGVSEEFFNKFIKNSELLDLILDGTIKTEKELLAIVQAMINKNSVLNQQLIEQIILEIKNKEEVEAGNKARKDEVDLNELLIKVYKKTDEARKNLMKSQIDAGLVAMFMGKLTDDEIKGLFALIEQYDKLIKKIEEKNEVQLKDKKFSEMNTNEQLGFTSKLIGASATLLGVNKKNALISARLDQSAAIINTYTAVTDALKEGTGPMRYAEAAAAFAYGMKQVAAIEAQLGQMSGGNIAPKFAEGGYVGGNLHSQGGTMIEAERGEFVMSRNAVESIGLETLNQMNQSGGGSINVSVTGNVLTQDFVEGELAESIKEAVRRGSDFGLS